VAGNNSRHGHANMIIYEAHVKGFTMHPGVPPELRGTYAGPGHEAAIAHLVDLGSLLLDDDFSWSW
jgi:pullulanase/glycogen debranching enzyme